MLINFNETQAPCIFEHIGESGEKIVLSFQAIDQNDLILWSRTKGFKVPDHAWKVEKENGRLVRYADVDQLTDEQRNAMNLDDLMFAATKLKTIEGIKFSKNGEEVEFSPDIFTQDQIAHMLDLIRLNIFEFQYWFSSWMEGAKKKSGQMELIS